MQQETVTLVVAGLGIGGTLGGIVVGHLLTRSWQQKQWVLNCRKEEFREVVSAISSATIELMMYIHSQGSRLAQPETLYLDAQRVAAKTLVSRIYVASELKKRDIPGRYLQIGEEARESRAGSDALNKMNALIDEIVAIAIKG
jgi:hypothetical protein